MDRKRHTRHQTHRAKPQVAWHRFFRKETSIAALCCLIFAVVNLPRNATAGRGFSARSATQARGVVIPIYVTATNRDGSATLQAAAVVHIDTIEEGFQRRGFFRIGVLPLVALNGFTVEIIETNRTTEALAKVHDKVKRLIKSASAIEARHVALVFGDHQATIHADALHFGNQQTWELEQGTVAQSGQTRHFETAVFHLAGKAAGQIDGRESSNQFRLCVVPTTETNSPPR